MSGNGIVCYDAPSIFTISMACFLIVASIGSYIPQWWAIFAARSSTGLSFLSLSFGYFSGMLTLINTGILHWDRILCCQKNPELHYYQCLGNNLLSIQVACSPLCLCLLYLLYLYYFETEGQVVDSSLIAVDVTLDPDLFALRLNEYFWALMSFMFVSCCSILAAASAYFLYYGGLADAENVFLYAKALGILSAILVLFQWTPQIWTTFQMGRAGVLSLPFLLIQAPGSFLIVGFQISAKADWTTWVPYLVAGAEQMVLIGLLLFFHLRNWYFRPAVEVIGISDSDEHSVKFTNENADGNLFFSTNDGSVKSYQQ